MKEPKPTPPMPISLGGGEKLRVSESAVYYNIATGRVMHVPIKTNYDRLVSKSPEELAEWLVEVAGWLPMYEGKAHPILKWLKQEVEE